MLPKWQPFCPGRDALSDRDKNMYTGTKPWQGTSHVYDSRMPCAYFHIQYKIV